MATLFSDTRWTDSNPAIYISATYETRNRTSTTVDIRVVASVSAVYGSSYYGYNIQLRCRYGSYDSGYCMVKNNSPNKWTSAITYDFGWHTVSAAAASTSMSAYIDTETNSGRADTTFSGTCYFAVGNTAPYWPSGATFRLNYTGTIAENVSTITATTSGATDDQGNTITYRYRWYRAGSLVRTQETTSKSDSYSWSNVSAGQALYCIVDIKDSLTSYANAKTSNTIVKNTLTGASITTAPSIYFGTTSITLVRGSGTNTNGNGTFAYALSGNITIYNGTWDASNTSLVLTIWRTGDPIPSGAYIKFDDIKAYFRNSNYYGTFTLTLQTTNAYGTSKTSTKSVSVNLRQNPTAFSLNAPTGTYDFAFGTYYVINQKPIRLSWSASSDLLGGAITYSVYVSIDGGEWTLYTTTTNTYCNYSGNGANKAYTFLYRVTASTTYAYTRTVTQAESSKITLHYYNLPTLENITVIRNPKSYTIQWKVTQNTSLPSTLREDTFVLKKVDGDVSLLTFTVSHASGTSQFTTPVKTLSVDAEITSYVLEISGTDQTAAVMGLTPAPVYHVIPRYAARLTVRQKGVGVNAVAGDATSFMIHSNPFVQLDGASHIGGFSENPVAFYDKIYYDANGDIRAAVDLAAAETIICYIFDASGFRKGTTTTKESAVTDDVVEINRWTYVTIA